jgi:hypothetical protein
MGLCIYDSRRRDRIDASSFSCELSPCLVARDISVMRLVLGVADECLILYRFENARS